MFNKKFKSKDNPEELLKKAEIYLRYKLPYNPPSKSEREIKQLNNFDAYLFDAMIESHKKIKWSFRLYSVKYYILNFIESILVVFGISCISMLILGLMIFN